MVKSDGKVWRQGEGSAALVMNFFEVRDHMLFTEERLPKVNLLRLLIQQFRRVSADYTQMSHTPRALLRFETPAYLPLMADICGFVPLEDGVLHRLVDLPLHANQANKLLYQTVEITLHNGEEPIGSRGMIEASRARLDNLCITFEHDLEQSFGVLGAPQRPVHGT
jgi:hypothetical protein